MSSWILLLDHPYAIPQAWQPPGSSSISPCSCAYRPSVKGTGEAVMALSRVSPLCKQLLPPVPLIVGVWTGQMTLFGWICCWSKLWRKKYATRDARNALP